MLRNFHPPPTIYIPLSPSVSFLECTSLCWVSSYYSAVQFIAFGSEVQSGSSAVALVLFSCRANSTLMLLLVCRRSSSLSLSFPRCYKCNFPAPNQKVGVELKITFWFDLVFSMQIMVTSPSKGMGKCVYAEFHWRANSSERHLVRKKWLGKVTWGLYIYSCSVPAGSRYQNTSIHIYCHWSIL